MKWLRKLFGLDVWEYGTCFANNQQPQKARRNIKTGKVQFILWRKGERGHTEDFWIEFHDDHWKNFKPLSHLIGTKHEIL